METSQTELVDALRTAPLLAELAPHELQWLADHAEEARYAEGEMTFRPGESADYMVVILEGEIQAAPESNSPNTPIYIIGAGQITGFLPHSRMTKYGRSVIAVAPTRIARIHKRHFDEMLAAIPSLGPKLVGVMADRIRDTTRADIQYEKLAALGKLSAGLAHELNNPASAAKRAAISVRNSLDRLRAADAELHQIGISDEARAELKTIEESAIRYAAACTGLDALTRSDREERVGSVLTKLGVRNAWDFAPELVDAGLDEERLADIAGKIGKAAMPAALTRLASTLAVYQLSEDIEESTTRIADLVRAIKEYSWMDVAPEREIDVHDGLENTLTILKHRWKTDIQIERDYDPQLPRIWAHGGELNQVWTNLIDNAIDAMRSMTGEKLLRIRTALKGHHVLVEILDTGPGIPDAVRDHIFEPFFTTKPQGQGTGLGLDLAFRIVRKHHGDIRFESRPGRTCFQVRLPIHRTQP